jgi:hypothetical protein
MSILYFLNITKKIGEITVTLLAIADAVFFILPILTDIFFYDMWIWWCAIQILVNMVLLFCLTKEIIKSPKKERWLYIIVSLPLFAFAVDVVGTRLGTWQGGVVSKYVFIALFAVFLICFLVEFVLIIDEPIIAAAPPTAIIAPIVFAAFIVLLFIIIILSKLLHNYIVPYPKKYPEFCCKSIKKMILLY